MYETSATFKDLATSSLRRSRAEVKIGEADISADVFLLDYAHSYESLVGGFSAKSIEIEVKASVVDQNALRSEPVTVGLGFDGAEMVPLGIYYTDTESVEEDEATGRLRFIAYDSTLRFDRGYVAPTYPQTQQDLIAYICGKVGVPYTSEPLLHDAITIDADPWADEVVSYRQVINRLAEANIVQASISRTGNLTFRSALSEPESSVTITGAHYTELRVDKAQQPIDQVVIQGSSEEDNLIPEETEGLTVNNPLRLVTNPILELKRASYIGGLYSRANGFSYVPYEMKLFSRPDLDCGDAITVIDKNGVSQQTYISSMTLTWKGGLRGTFACPILPETGVRYELDGVEQALANTRAKLEKLRNVQSALEQSSTDLMSSMIRMMGAYETITENPDGSKVYQWHDRETIAQSDIIWRRTADALAYSRDGGKTWGGINAATDTLTAMIVNALQINASQVRLSDGSNVEGSMSAMTAQILDGLTEFRQGLESVNSDLSTAITQTAESITAEVEQRYLATDEFGANFEQHFATTITQTDQAIEFATEQVRSEVTSELVSLQEENDRLREYVRIVGSTIELGRSNSPIILKITNDRIGFVMSGSEVAYFSNNVLNVTDAEFFNSLKIGKFQFFPQVNGHLSFRKVDN